MKKETNKTTTTRESKSIKKPELTLLQAIERIVEKSDNCKLSAQFMKQCKAEIDLVATSYGITPLQAILFAVTIEQGPWHVEYRELADHLGVNKIKALGFGPEIETLVSRRIMRYCDAKDKGTFKVPECVINALRHNKVYEQPHIQNLDFDSLFGILEMWFDDLSEDAITAPELAEDIERLYRDNTQVEFARKMLELKLSSMDLLLMSMFCHLYVNNEDDRVLAHQLEDAFPNRRAYARAKSELRNGSHSLMNKALIEHVCEDGSANTSMYHLSDKAKRDILVELKVSTPEIKLSDLTYPDKITPKTLYYPEQMRHQINELNEFLDDKQFVQIQKRLQEHGLRNGFACLFYGSPGTGKTETVYQLARVTGRGIMAVDVPQIKSKWVGESEKNIKALFDRYREAVKKAKVAPILLFNEADAIFGVRKNGAENAVDKMENTIQNIILQEMEDLQGIMIATTNLAGNLDGAFERRFLYKVRFDKPDAKVRRCIWQEMIPDLSDQDAQALADGFDLSGGQIENIVRKDTINHILHGDSDDRLALLKGYCTDETIGTSQSRRRLGF